jgi:two-component system response regulator RegA
MLVVDDDAVLRERMARAFSDRGLEVRTAADGSKALKLARDDSPELAVVDLKMPGAMSGLDVVRELKAIDATTRVLVLTGYGSIATAVEAMRLGAVNYMPKPADADEVLEALEGPKGASTGDGPLAPSLARAEWEHINRVLSDCTGNVSEAARRLGLHRRTLQRKLQKYPPPR